MERPQKVDREHRQEVDMKRPQEVDMEHPQEVDMKRLLLVQGLEPLEPLLAEAGIEELWFRVDIERWVGRRVGSDLPVVELGMIQWVVAGLMTP